MNSNFQMALS